MFSLDLVFSDSTIIWITHCYKQALKTYCYTIGCVRCLCGFASTHRLKWKLTFLNTYLNSLGENLFPGLAKKPAQSSHRLLSTSGPGFAVEINYSSHLEDAYGPLACSIHLKVQEWTKNSCSWLDSCFQEENYLVFSSQIIQFDLTVYNFCHRYHWDHLKMCASKKF